MKALCPLVISALLAILPAGCSGKPGYTTLDGTHGRFSDFHGRWMLVNYWAAWCKPCIREMPALKAFSDRYARQAVVLAVNYDGATGAALRQQVQQLHVDVPVLIDDPAQQLGIQRPSGLPTTYVFDPQGRFVTRLVGEQTAQSLAAAIGGKQATP